MPYLVLLCVINELGPSGSRRRGGGGVEKTNKGMCVLFGSYFQCYPELDPFNLHNKTTCVVLTNLQ